MPDDDAAAGADVEGVAVLVVERRRRGADAEHLAADADADAVVEDVAVDVVGLVQQGAVQEVVVVVVVLVVDLTTASSNKTAMSLFLEDEAISMRAKRNHDWKPLKTTIE